MRWLRFGALLFGVLGAITQAQEPPPASKPRSFEIAEDGTVTVRGRVTFTDRQRDVRENVRGSVRGMLWYANEKAQIGTGMEIEIVDGTWTATFRRSEHAGERPDYVSFSAGKVEDNPVILETDRLSLTDGTDFVLRLRAIPELRLHVVDAETKKELTDVQVFRSRSWSDSSTLHPGSDVELQRLVDSGKSPVLVPAPDEVRPDATTTLWVRAPGYAWLALKVVSAEGGVREAPLVRGGSVRIAITGKVPEAPKVALRVYDPANGRPLLDLAIGRSAPESLEDLAPGRYEARLELGEWFEDPRVLARAPMEIQAGRTGSVELVVASEVAPPERVTLNGVFVIPTGWKRAGKGVSVALEPLRGTDRWAEKRWLEDEDLQRGEKEGEYRFVFPDAVVGRYVLVFEPGQYQRVVRVTKDGAADLRIELPEPVEIVVRVVDRDTKQPRKGVSLSWHPEWPPGVSGGSLESASAAADSNEVRLLVPGGRIQVGSLDSDFEVPETTLEVSPDKREFEVLAAVLQGVKVALYEGTTRIPIGFGSEWSVSLLTVDGAYVPARTSESDSELMLSVAKSGTYVLHVTAPDGYRPVADRQVKLGPSPFPTIDIKVARK